MLAKDGFGMGPIKKHYRSLKFNPVIGGTQIAFRGAWTNGTAGVESLHTGSHVFVLADILGGFGQLVFGRRRNTAVDRAKIHCIAGLQAELRNAVDSDSSGVAAVNVPNEIDLMGDAAMARVLEGEGGRVKFSRSERRRFANKKETVRQRPVEGRVVTVRFPKYPGLDVGDDVVNATCLLETGKQRPKGVWIRREDFPWLVTFAAMEVANADGQELFPQSSPAVVAADDTGTLKYSVGQGAWDLTWIDPSTKVMHHLTKPVPRRRYGRGGVVAVIPSEEFIAVKERARRELLREAGERGYHGHGDDPSNPETA